MEPPRSAIFREAATSSSLRPSIGCQPRPGGTCAHSPLLGDYGCRLVTTTVHSEDGVSTSASSPASAGRRRSRALSRGEAASGEPQSCFLKFQDFCIAKFTGNPCNLKRDGRPHTSTARPPPFELSSTAAQLERGAPPGPDPRAHRIVCVGAQLWLCHGRQWSVTPGDASGSAGTSGSASKMLQTYFY